MDFGCGGFGAGGWIAMTVFWVSLLALVIWAVTRAGAGWGAAVSRTSQERGRGDTAPESPEDIVDRRFAAGEIDEDTYQSMRAALRSSRAPHDGPR